MNGSGLLSHRFSSQDVERARITNENNHALPRAVLTQGFSELPHLQRPRAVLKRLRQVGGLDVLTTRQVGDGARQLEDVIVAIIEKF
jgi:hypothetical protein